MDERLEIMADERELAERGYHALLLRAVAEQMSGGFAFARPRLKRFGHLVKGLCQFAQLTLVIFQLGTAGEVPRRQPPRRAQQAAHLPDDEVFPAKPGRAQR